MSTAAGEDPLVFNGDSQWPSDQEGSEDRENEEGVYGGGGCGDGYGDDDDDVLVDEDGEHDSRAVGPSLSLADHQVCCSSAVTYCL